MYSKKILIFNTLDNLYSLPNRTLGGVLKLTTDSGGTLGTLSLSNYDSMRYGVWWLLLRVDGNVYTLNITNLSKFEFGLPLSGIQSVSAVVVAQNLKTCVLSYANNCGQTNPDWSLVSSLPSANSGQNSHKAEDKVIEPARQPSLHLFEQMFMHTDETAKQSDKVQPKQSADEYVSDGKQRAEEETEYEKFVCSTDNYYAKERTEDEMLYKKPIADYSGAIDRYFAETQMNSECYYMSVKKELTAIFEQFPTYMPLTLAVKDSVWVRIDYQKSDKFFLLGLITSQDVPKYICYALLGRSDGDKGKFIPFYCNGETYSVLYQDAVSGKMCLSPQVSKN